MRGPAVKVGQPLLLLPYSPLKNERKAKTKNKTKQQRERQEKHYPTPRPRDGPPPAPPLEMSCGGPWPPLLPFHLVPLPLEAFFPFLLFVPGWDSEN